MALSARGEWIAFAGPAGFTEPANRCSMTCMLSRRSFSRLAGLSTLGGYLAPGGVLGQRSSNVERAGSASRVSVMLWTLNANRSFEQQLAVVAQAGYRNVELVNEFLKWSEPEFSRVLEQMQALRISVDAMAGLTTGFSDPAKSDAFLRELQNLVAFAHRLQCPQVILLSGKRLDDLSPGRQHDASLETLRRAAELLQRENLTGVIEPIDRLENPSIYLDGVAEAFTLTRTVASPHLLVLYDLYHEQRSQGNLIEKLEQNIDQVGLIHVADVPGRHEPGTGEMNFDNLYRTLGRLRYQGMIAMEFYPTGDTVETLRRARLAATQGMQRG